MRLPFSECAEQVVAPWKTGGYFRSFLYAGHVCCADELAERDFLAVAMVRKILRECADMSGNYFPSTCPAKLPLLVEMLSDANTPR